MRALLACALSAIAVSFAGCSSHAQNTQVSAALSRAGNVPAPAPADPALVPAVPAGDTVDVNLILVDKTVAIAPGVSYRAWTFDGTVPGPVVHARVGQTIVVTLTNHSSIGHSIDFHSALAPPDIAYQTIAPGTTIRFSWVARYPGVFLYHCGTPPVLMHISNGMYGAVVVDPQNGWPDGPMRSYVLLQSEFYTQPVPGHSGLYEGNMEKARESMPDYVMFNGRTMRYEDDPLPIDVGRPVRVFVVDAGPSHFSAFHVVGAIFDIAYVDGNPANVLHGIQTMTIGPGDGAMVEFTVHQPSRYPFVTHSFGDADLGAMGAFIAR
ncbi:MAG: multicopper oxidase domain-containing protein [Candidatus Tyrphobacter sp.]